MKQLFVWLDKLLVKHKALKRWKRTVTVLAAIITFVTTYALILPAITVEKNQAEEVGGMYLEQEKDRDDLFLENALEPTGIPIAADQENAVTFSYVDEGMTATAIFSTEEKILDGSELVVTPVDPESEEYAAFSSRSAELLDKEFIYDVTTCSFYDFALFYKNVDVTPQTGLVDIQIIFHDNVVEHVDDTLFAGRFARLVDKEDGFSAMSADGNIEADETDNLFKANDELISTNPDDSSVIELTDGVITALSLKGYDLAESDSIVGILAGYVDEEIKAAAAETDAAVPEYDDPQEENSLVDAVEGGEGEAAQAVTTLKATGTDYTVTLTCDAASGVPEGAALTVSEIEEDSKEYHIYLEETKKAMGLAEEDSLPRFAARFFDIKIMVGEEEFKPKAGVSVEITYTEPLAETPDAEVNAIHFADEAAKAEVIETNTAEIKNDGTATVEFVAESFSVYGVIYTVDFHWEANEVGKSGETWEIVVSYGEEAEIPAGASLSVREIVKRESEDVTEAEEAEDEYAEYLTQSAERLRHSEEDIVYARYFDISILDANGNEVKPKSEVQVEISLADKKKDDKANLLHFEDKKSEVELLESSEDGDALRFDAPGFSVYGIVVIEKEDGTFVFKGDGYTVSVAYTKEAKIPLGTVLEVSEVEEGTEEYTQYLGRTWSEINKEYYEIESGREVSSTEDIPEASLKNVDSARFFKISLKLDGRTVEPLVPVQVSVDYDEGLFTFPQAEPGMVTFTEEDANLKDDVDVIQEGESTVHFSSLQDALFTMGTFITHETQDMLVRPKAQPISGDPESFPDSSTLLLRGPEGEDEGDGDGGVQYLHYDQDTTTEIDKPSGTKTLTPNTYGEEDDEDGTYTLTLSVKGHSDTTVRPPDRKANVLFVMDRSSSMLTNMVDDEEVYWEYGTWGDSSLEFRQDIGGGYNGSTAAFYGIINGEYVPLNVRYSGWSTIQSITYTINGVTRNYPTGSKLYIKSKTTRMAAEQSALEGVIDLLLDKNTAEDPDNVEIRVISFGNERFDNKTWKNETESGTWVQGNDSTAVMDVVNSNRYTSGTNWEEALQYAYAVMTQKKGNDTTEDYYVIFLTDGEPTATAQQHSAYYVGNDPSEDGYKNGGFIKAYDAAKDDAKALRDAGIEFYNIFTFRNELEENDLYSIYLTNYAYGNGDYLGTEQPETDDYYDDAQTITQLNDVFRRIFFTITDTIGHNNVSVTDTLTTDAMTTTLVEGQTSGYEYEVKNASGTTVYKVTAEGPLPNPEDAEPVYPTVTFTVPGSAQKTYTAEHITENGRTVYYVTTQEGDTYKMALADIDEDTGELVWDLAPVGFLMDDCTYSVSFIVWPDQGAYDYVAGLSNHMDGYVWDTSLETYEDLTDTKGYEIGGVDGYPSIVRYPDGTFAVLSNTDQEIHYTVTRIEEKNGEPNGEPDISGPYYIDLPQPDPMPLEDTQTYLEKQWSAERNPALLAQYLYTPEGESKEFVAEFDIFEENEYLNNPEAVPYRTVALGWDSEKGEYVWAEDSPIKTVVYNGRVYRIGMRWSDKFSIPNGLMLSKARLDELELNEADYPHAVYKGTTYYVLEQGHDYNVVEKGNLGYEFDFIAPVFHPMLLDGVPMNVTFKEKIIGEMVPGQTYELEDITAAPGGIGTLLVENKLRAYINLEKNVVEADGVTAILDDTTKFTYEIELHNGMDPGPFVDDSVPWYGIDGLFYHTYDEATETYTYYQAEVTNTINNKSHTLTLTTESGEVYDAVCTDEEGYEQNAEEEDYIFDEDVPGPSFVKYNDGTQDIILKLYGNEMDYEEGDRNNVSAELQISSSQMLSLANIPKGTTYTITEKSETGYSYVSVRREIRNGDTVERRSTTRGGDAEVEGTIVEDRDNHFIFTNKVVSTDITVKKVDKNGKTPLPGAVFTLTKAAVGDDPAVEIIKPGEGESDTGTYTFVDLKDGSYTLVETTAPAGYTGISGNVATFTVSGGEISIVSKASDVDWNPESGTFTVDNTASVGPGELIVRKMWLDADGNPTSYNGELELTLNQWVQNTADNYSVSVNFQYYTYNNYGQQVTNTISPAKTGLGTGPATISWRYSWGVNRNSITVYGLNNGEYSISPNSGTNTSYTLTINNVDGPRNIYIGYSYNANSNPYQYIGDVSIEEAVGEGYDLVGTKSITLGRNGTWTKHFDITNVASMTDTALPSTYNGKQCFYTVNESSVPGYVLDTELSNVDEYVPSGFITAYNKKTERGSLAIKKLLSVSADPPTNGNTALANGRYNFTISKPAPTQEDPDATEIIKYVQIRIKNGRAAYKVSDSPISFEDTTDFEHVYFEGAIVDDLIPGTYYVTETTHQLDNPPAYNMELVDIDADGNEANEASLADMTTKVIVTADDLPKVFSSFTNMLIPEVDVPVVKTWVWSDEDDGKVSSWSATFNLEYREILVSGEADPDAATRWTPVYEDNATSGEPEQRNVTITSSSAEGTGYFTDLPIYKIHDNGSVYRLIYAVDEVSYTVSFNDDRQDKTWSKNASGHLDQHYSPTYEQDAGEDEEPEDLVSWYTITLTNGESTKETINEIDLSIRKTWENDDDNVISGEAGSYAKFRLMRTYHEESLDLSQRGLANNDPVNVKLMSGSETITNFVVPGGAPVYVVGLVEPGETVDLTFSDGSSTVNLTGGSGSSTGQQFVVSSSCFTAADNLVVQLGAGNTDVLVGGMSGLRLASFDTAENGGYDISVEYPNDAFNNQPAGQEFTLSNADEWQKNWVNLPQVVEERTVSGDHVVLKTIVYSYYLVETECNPVNFDAVFTDEEGNPIGDVRYPVSSDTKIIAENREITEATVRKIWDDDDNERELRPSTLTVELYANGEDTGRYVTLTSENWTTGKTISNLPKYHNDTEIDYYWIEGSLPSGYFLKSIAKKGSVTTLTNSYSEYDLKTSYSGTKTWADSDNLYNLRPEELPVKLQRKVGDGEWEDYRDDPSWEKTGSSWTYTFDELPVFDESGNVYLYQAVESEPTCYDGSTSNTATEFHFGEITYLSHAESKQRITEDNKLVWNLESLIDLAFAAVKTTANDPTTVWTSRTPTPQEREAIENYLNNSQSDPLPDHNHRLVWVHGSEVVDDSHGVIGFEMNGLTVTISFSGSNVWSQFVYGQFNNEGEPDSIYNIGRTDFTNTLETASLSGTKTWYIEGEDIPADPTLELTRTYQIVTIVDETMTVTESEPEVVTVMTGGEPIPLQPTWEGEGIIRTFTYSNLPKYDLHGRQYIYRVRETGFVIGEGDNAATYTVRRNQDGTFTAVADKPEADSFNVTQDAHNNIVNSSLITNLEIIKVEKGYWDNSHTIDGAVFKLTLVDENNHDIVGGGAYTSGNVTVENGKLIFENLRPGRYKLEEITPPTGYVLVESPWYFEIDNTSKASLDETYIMASANSAADNSFYIQNERGAELPSTGGPGNMIFYMVGAAMIAFAGVILRRRIRGMI